MDERFLVTGSGGCIGAWTVAQLVGEGTGVVAFDASEDDHRLRLLLLRRAARRARARARRHHRPRRRSSGCSTSTAITHVVHLAALQVPFCRADPPLGARVNVVGTVNVFEAVARRRDRIAAPVVYASSVAAYDALDEGEDHAAMEGVPSTLYGVYKRANEGTAVVYAEERDTGASACARIRSTAPAATRASPPRRRWRCSTRPPGEPYTLPFGGAYQLQYAPDVAAAFIAAARSEGAEGAALRTSAGRPSASRRSSRRSRRPRPARGSTTRPSCSRSRPRPAAGDADPARGRRDGRDGPLPRAARARPRHALIVGGVAPARSAGRSAY